MDSINHEKVKTFISPVRMVLRNYSRNVLLKYSLVLWNLNKTDLGSIYTAL